MFGSFNSFGQSSNSSPFGTQTPSLFGQTNNASSNLFATSTPFSAQTGSSIFGGTSTGVFGQTNNATSNLFATSTPFGAQQTGSSMFRGNSTGVFGAPQASSPFGSSSQALGSSTPSPAFGGNSTFGGQQSFGFSTPQTNNFGSTSQQSQSAFGNSTFGPSTPFGTSSTPAFGTTSTPGFGVSSTPAFGSTALGNSSIAFGNNAFSNNAFGSGGAFAASSSPAFGSGGAFAPSSSPAFGQSTSTFCPQSPFGGAQASTPLFGGQSTSGGQQVGSRVMTYAPTTEAEQGGNNQSAGKLVSLSAMAVYKNKTHEELRWEDYQRGDKGGQLPAGTGFGLTNSQFSPSPANPPNPFSSSTATTNPFAQNTPTTNTNFAAPFGHTPTTPFGQTPTTPFGQTTSTPSTNFAAPFGQTPTTPFGQTTSTPSTKFASPFGQPTNTPSTNFTSPFGQTPTTPSTNFMSPFGQPTNTPSTNFTSPFGQPTNTPSTNFTSPFGQTTSTLSTNFSSPLGQTPTTPSMFGTSSTNTSVFAPSTGGFATPTTQPFGSSSTPPAQGSTSAFNFGGNFNNSQTSPFGQSNTSSQFGQNTIPAFPQTNNFSTPSSTGFGTMYSSSSSLTTNNSPFGQTTPATLTTYQPAQPAQTPGALAFNFSQPQSGGMATFSQCNNFMQVPASAKPAVMQPVPVTSPFGTLPALPQISIAQCGNSPSIQYGISSMPVVDKPAPVRMSPLLTSRHLLQRRVKLPARKYRPGDDGSKVSFFSDEENSNTPKADALFIPRENPRALFIRPVEKEKSAPPKNKPTPLQENDKNNGEICDAPPVKANQKPNWRHENHGVDKNGSNSSPSKADIESIMPKLQHSEYFTEPRIQELAAKESVHPGYCKRIREFVVGRHGYGSIKFLGETDVCKLELEMLVQFNNREVMVYKDESQKPPIGEGLNKPAEVTLLNIKCMDKKSGKQVTEGSRLDKYKEMLKRKAQEQDAQFVSYDPVNGEWKFRVEHF